MFEETVYSLCSRKQCLELRQIHQHNLWWSDWGNAFTVCGNLLQKTWRRTCFLLEMLGELCSYFFLKHVLVSIFKLLVRYQTICITTWNKGYYVNHVIFKGWMYFRWENEFPFIQSFIHSSSCLLNITLIFMVQLHFKLI